jgi:predicted AAA+ superfamily ATPase
VEKMHRLKIASLFKWKNRPDRRPLLVKGARQVGKTWLIREFGKSFDNFVEFNFEKEVGLGEIFTRAMDPKKINEELSLYAGKRIVPGSTLVFFDEIQQCLPAIKSIRYYYEELPELHLIAAGSLLNMVLDKIPTGVGRVSFLNLYPLNFSEFLDAAGESLLREHLNKLDAGKTLLEIHHNKLLNYVRIYMLLGGMPAVLASYFKDGDLFTCQEIQQDLLQSLFDDFHKYSKESQINYLTSTLRSIPIQLGSKFKYTAVDRSIKSRYLSKALILLEMAGLAYKIFHSSADGVPISSRIRSNRFKVIFFDVGLAQRLLNINLKHWMTTVDISSVNRGAIAEQFVGQELAAWLDAGPLNPLTYWHRETRGSSAEVDYLIQKGDEILPLEVKESTQGGMKSLHLFLKEKNRKRGIKVSKYGFSDDSRLLTIPFYAMEYLLREPSETT